MWLFVGLGNPGPRYDNTPHNLGFDVVDELARRLGWSWKEERRWRCLLAEGSHAGEEMALMKPLTFMNLSGEAVAPWARYYKVPTENLLVVSDEIALPVGRMRLRPSGSAGGHNGLQNIIDHFGTEAVPRLRLGATPDGNTPRDMVRHVLSKWDPDSRVLAALAIEKAADCLVTAARFGIARAANDFNGYDARKQGR